MIVLVTLVSVLQQPEWKVYYSDLASLRLKISMIIRVLWFFQLRELESELDEERKGRVSAANAKKKIEMDMADLEEQLDASNRVKEDGIRQLKKYQQQVKDIQRDLDDARQARDEISEQAKENERKAKQLEADYLQMQEVRGCAGKHDQFELL